LKKSIKGFGFNAPVLVDKNGMLVAGHARLEAAKLLNCSQIPVICLDDLNETEAAAYMLADNKLCDRSSWDEPLLATHLKELSELASVFDLESTGFEAPEIDLRILSMQEEGLEAADDYDVPCGPPVTQTGDVWRLDDHVICCGSALDQESYSGFPEDRVSAVFADPPYNVPINGHVSGLGKVKHREFAQASGEMTPGEFADFLADAIRMVRQCSEDGAIHFWCMDFRHMREMLDAGRHRLKRR
jgi:hypothetical protein